MAQPDGASHSEAASLNNVAAVGFGNGNRRIDRLRQLCYDCNLGDNDARQFGKLTATATWEKLLLAHGLEFEPRTETTLNTVATASQESQHSINFLEWVDWSQALALALASVGFVLLIFSLFPRMNSLHLFPQMRITIEIGDRK